MSAPADGALPDPELLEAARQAQVRRRFVFVVGTGALWTAFYANLTGLVIGVAFLWSPLALASVSVGAVLPFFGLAALSRWSFGPFLEADRRALAVLGLTRLSRWPGRLAVAGAAAAALTGAVVGAGLGLPPSNTGVAGGLFALASAVPWARRRRDPEAPGWVLRSISAWLLIAGAVAACGIVGWADTALVASAALLIGAPFGLPALLLSRALAARMERDDAGGRLLRAWAPLLPPALAHRARRLEAGAAGALPGLLASLAVGAPPATLGAVLLEIGACLEELGDARAPAIYAAAARVAPGDPRPFAGLARVLAATDPDRSRAYATFAEQNAARALV